MNTKLCVADVRIQLGSLFSSADFLPYLNQALELITSSGRWKGAKVYVDFQTSPGYITLPYEYLSILGVCGDRLPLPVFDDMHEYIESGPGVVDDTLPADGLISYMGDGYVTRINPPESDCTLRMILENAADIGKTFRFFGTNADDDPIFTSTGAGIDVTPAALTTNIGQVFNTITGIQCPIDANGHSDLDYAWTLYTVSPTATVTEVGRYMPNDARPCYARYKTGVFNEEDDSTRFIRCLCQRRYIPVYKETDWVIPGSIAALKAGMKAAASEDAGNYKEAVPLWDRCYQVLNDMTHSARGAAKPEFDWLPWGSVNPFPNVT